MIHQVIDQKKIADLIDLLEKNTVTFTKTASDRLIECYGVDSYVTLIGCILSLRTTDAISFAATVRLMDKARTPYQMVTLTASEIEHIIYPVGFYKRKSQHIIALSIILINEYGGIVPSDEQSLLRLPGVGRKTMNLVRSVAFGIPAMCVDTHVHRLANRWGLVTTKTPEETEVELRRTVDPIYWNRLSRLFVLWGQNVCKPRKPNCTCLACSMRLL